MLLGHPELIAAIRGFGDLVRREEARLNALNVFPVADADTGTNLVRTLDVMIEAVSPTRDLAAAGQAVRTSALSGRGNSGLIIGQYLAGFVEPLDRPAEGRLLAQCFSVASNTARDAVAHPVKGTVLSVASAVAREAARRKHVDLVLLAAEAEVAGLEALEHTQTQLPVLTEAGVIDSGGAGLVLFLEALAAVLAERPLVIGECRTGLDQGARSSGGIVGYEIQFRISDELAGPDAVRSLLDELGTDVIVAEADGVVSAHVHVADAHVATNAISGRLESRPGATAISYDVEPLIERTDGRRR